MGFKSDIEIAQVLTTNTWSSTENTKQKSTTIF